MIKSVMLSPELDRIPTAFRKYGKVGVSTSRADGNYLWYVQCILSHEHSWQRHGWQQETETFNQAQDDFVNHVLRIHPEIYWEHARRDIYTGACQTFVKHDVTCLHYNCKREFCIEMSSGCKDCNWS